MDYTRITSRKTLKRVKAELLSDIKSSNKHLQKDMKDSFVPQKTTAFGTKLDYAKIINYAVMAYKGILWLQKVRSYFSSKKRRR